MKLSVITLNYQSAHLLQRLLINLYHWHQSLDFETIVISNSVEDREAVQQIVANFPRIRLLEPPQNLYFAPGINYAAQYAQGEYLVFLNVDAYFIQPALQQMVAYLDQHQDYGVVVGAIHEEDTASATTADSTLHRAAEYLANSQHYQKGPVTKTGNGLPTIGTELIRHTGLIVLLRALKAVPHWYKTYWYEDWDRLSDRDIAAGCDAFLMIRREFFLSQGGYSSQLLMYLTEEDIGSKLKQHHLKMRYLAGAKIIHNWSYSTSKVTKPKIAAILIWDRYIYFRNQYNVLLAFGLCVITVILNPLLWRQISQIIHWLGQLKQETKMIEAFVHDKRSKQSDLDGERQSSF